MDHLLGSSKGPRVASVDDKKGNAQARLEPALIGMTLYPIKIDFKSLKTNNQKIKPYKYRLLSIFIGVQGCQCGRYREQARPYRACLSR
ncbi:MULTISPECIES: hypothetical protein [Pseudomonas]|uniref:hypothetical protein n=1 Tax=Pseudomonas TaxID=286 RepID=UPI001179C865|nr:MULTISPECIES: hypothetical protein [Pseudomonas]